MTPSRNLSLSLLLLVLVSCGQLTNPELPTTIEPLGLPVPPDPGPVDATPGVPPSAEPTPGEGGESPTPTPAPDPTPVADAACRLPPRPDGSPCEEESPSFEQEVATAQAMVARDRPDLVIGDTVTDLDGYVQEVARVLRVEFGLCAEQGGPPDEVAVKSSNDWNDQYDIVIGGTFTVWTNYTVTCRPARF